jgi:hypothetical protein
MEATSLSETSGLTRPTRQHIPEDGILLTFKIFKDVLLVRPTAVGAYSAMQKTQNLIYNIWY